MSNGNNLNFSNLGSALLCLWRAISVQYLFTHKRRLTTSLQLSVFCLFSSTYTITIQCFNRVLPYTIEALYHGGVGIQFRCERLRYLFRKFLMISEASFCTRLVFAYMCDAYQCLQKKFMVFCKSFLIGYIRIRLNCTALYRSEGFTDDRRFSVMEQLAGHCC